MAIRFCYHCGAETTNPKYCSKSCAAKQNNKTPKRKITKKCSKCDSIVRNYRSLLCEHHYQDYLNNKKENMLNLTIEDYTSRECIKKLQLQKILKNI